MSLVKRVSWAASVSVLVAVAVVGGIATWLSIGSLDRRAQAALDIVSNGSAARIGEWIAANERLVASMAPETADSPASLADAEGKDDARLMHVLEVARQAGGFRQTFIGIAGDRRYLRMPPGKMPAGYDPTGRPWFKQAVSEDKLVIPTPYFDAMDHDLVMTFALPVKHDGKVFGVMGGFNSLDTEQKIVVREHDIEQYRVRPRAELGDRERLRVFGEGVTDGVGVRLTNPHGRGEEKHGRHGAVSALIPGRDGEFEAQAQAMGSGDLEAMHSRE